jgi:hypothetical protein
LTLRSYFSNVVMPTLKFFVRLCLTLNSAIWQIWQIFFPLPDCQRFYWPPRLHPCFTRRSHRSRETNSVERQRKIRIPFSGELTNCCNSEYSISCCIFIIGNCYLFLLSVSTFQKIHENWWYDNSFWINFVDFDKMALPIFLMEHRDMTGQVSPINFFDLHLIYLNVLFYFQKFSLYLKTVLVRENSEFPESCWTLFAVLVDVVTGWALITYFYCKI